MYYVYLVKSELFSDQIYTGFTENIEERILAHNMGKSVHTAKYRPWKLQTYLVFQTKEQALSFEKYLKSHSGRVFAAKRLF
jgi:putative endonuclease